MHSITNRIFFSSLVFTLLILASCRDHNDIDITPEEPTAIEEAINNLQDAYDSGDTIAYISQDAQGYLITFTNRPSITLPHDNDNENSNDGVTPILKVDPDGYWNVSYDEGSSFSNIIDQSENPVSAIENSGIGIKVALIDGKYVYDLYKQDSPDTIIESILTSYTSNPASMLQSIVEDQSKRQIILTLADNTELRYNLDVQYPTSITLLTDQLNISGKELTAKFDFQINPTDSYIFFTFDGENPNLQLDQIVASRAGDPDSYITCPTAYHITDVVPSLNEDGTRIYGQYTVTVQADAIDADGEEIVALVLTTTDRQGNPVKIYSSPMTVAFDTHPHIYGITIGGLEAIRTDGNTFHIKLPYGSKTSEIAAEFDTNSDIFVGNVENPKTLDLSQPVKLTASFNGATREYTLIAYYSNLPILYINTPAPIVSKEDWVKNCTIQIANAGEYDNIFSSSQMKGRGNSTWQYPKKPYAIKLDKKSEVLGMPKHKRWCLLANWLDRTNIRNEVSLEIGRRLSGLEWTPKGKFVDVVFNGKFLGNYYLCEQIKVDKNRVNIDEMSGSDIEGESISGGYLIELDKNYDEVNKFKSNILNLPVNFKDPDEDVLQPAQYNYMKNYFNDVELKLDKHTDYSVIESMIDIDSFIDWWLLNELTCNWEPNHPKSSYMYKKRNGKLYAGPGWDFDWDTYNTADGWRIKGAIWYRYLFTYPEFINRVKERWSASKASLATIPDHIQTIANDISESSVYDCSIWPITKKVNGDEKLSHSESVERMKRNYINRFNWIDTNIPKLTTTL
ncbi:MAG: CotH kinase family protein [Muribaculaceae bacterium]|nr:CotH kinase family protein [Muribaculaceae bacterium]